MSLERKQPILFVENLGKKNYYDLHATESSFNLSTKKATSRLPSYGLLQVLANAAGVALLVGVEMPSPGLKTHSGNKNASSKPFTGGR